MTKHTEVTKLAQELRALADRFSEGWYEGIKIDASDIVLLSDAAEALASEAKEQPAPATELREQEPVAAQSVMTVRIWRDKNSDQNAEFKNWHKLPDGEHILYTSPPTLSLAQRQARSADTWVGLTDEEILEAWCIHLDEGDEDEIEEWRHVINEAREIEAKLKEKNNG